MRLKSRKRKGRQEVCVIRCVAQFVTLNLENGVDRVTQRAERKILQRRFRLLTRRNAKVEPWGQSATALLRGAVPAARVT